MSPTRIVAALVAAAAGCTHPTPDPNPPADLVPLSAQGSEEDLTLDTAAAPGGKDDGAGPQIVYLNFEGATLEYGDDWAPLHRSALARFTGSVMPPFDGTFLYATLTSRAEMIELIAERVRRHFEPWNVVFTLVPPASDAYTMVVVGGSRMDLRINEEHAGALGLALLDCENRNRGNVAYVFTDDLSYFTGSPEWAIANMIAHELGHTFGLAHKYNGLSGLDTPPDAHQFLMFDRYQGTEEATWQFGRVRGPYCEGHLDSWRYEADEYELRRALGERE